jgi:6-phosphogluconolactonase
MQPEIRVVETVADLARAGAAEFVSHATTAVQERGIFTVALSGGSTPRQLYSLLASEPEWRDSLPWRNMHFFWGDERHVPPDDPASNYRMVNESLLSKVSIPSENVHPIRAEGIDAQDAADKYEQELRQFFQTPADQLPRFDLVMLGLGADGHTASLFPNTPALHEMERLVFANWVESLSRYRITLTLPVLNHAANVLFLVGGAEKAKILRLVLADDRATTYPAQLIQPTNGSLIWLLDRAASGTL